MRGGVVRHISVVESEVAAAQALEIGHGGAVDGGVVVAVLVGDDELALARAVSAFPGGNLG